LPRSPAAIAQALDRKRAAGEFDVFLCHNGADKPAVKAIAQRLKALGVMPWLDEWSCGRDCRGSDCSSSKSMESGAQRYSWVGPHRTLAATGNRSDPEHLRVASVSGNSGATDNAPAKPKVPSF
jgi:hypothetical protein